MTPRRTVLFAAGLILAGIASPGPPPGGEERFLEADRAWRSGSLARSQALLQGIEHEARQASDLALRARALRDLGRTLDSRARPEEAEAAFAAALDLTRALRDEALEASVLVEQGFASWRRADYASAERLAAAAAAAEHAERPGPLALRARIAYKRGDHGTAQRLAGEVLLIHTEAGDLQGQADAHQLEGEILLDLRAFALARRAFEERLSLVRRLEDPRQEAHAMNYLGFVWQSAGDLERALALQDEAVGVARRQGDEGALSHALHSLGSVHRDLGLLDSARADYQEAIRLREVAGDPRSRGWSYAGLGRVEKERGRPRQAMDAYGAAVEIFEGMRDRRATAWHLLELARLHAIVGDRRAARRAYEKTLEAMTAIELPYAPLAFTEYGLLLAEEGEADRALEAGGRARAEADAGGNPEMRWTAAHGQGRILRRLHRPQEALLAFLDAVSIIEEMRGELLPTDGAKSGFFERRQGVFEDAAAMLVDLGRPERALEIAERARSRAFLDLLGSGGRDPEPAVALHDEEPETAEEGEGLAARARGAPPAPPAPASAVSAPVSSDALLNAPDLTAMREEARQRQAPILVYFSLQHRLLSWLLTPEGEVRHTVQAIGRAALQEAAEACRDEGGGDPARRDLYRRLVLPFESFLPRDPARTVFVVPHGPLFLLSFAGLLDGRGRYLAERHALAYAPSIGVLRQLRTRTRPAAARPRRVLVVGNPAMPRRRKGDPALPALPGAEEEAEIVRRVWSAGGTTVLRGAEARESAVRRLAPEYAIVHLATHGVLRPDDPLRSYLALAEGEGGDGHLTVREVLDLRIPADLVVLSACDTGRGRISADGVMGLCRAFLSAGAGAVVATLWRIADPVAQRQMGVFHRELRGGAPEGEALRRAQVEVLRALRAGTLKTPDGAAIPPSPAYWAAFVLLGGEVP